MFVLLVSVFPDGARYFPSHKIVLILISKYKTNNQKKLY